MSKRIKKYKETGKDYESIILSKEDVLKIVEEFPTTKTKDLAKSYNCSRSLIECIASHYDLKKNDEYLKKMKAEVLTLRNQTVLGRKMSKELVRKIALKYNTKKEFCYNDSSAYSYANKNGIMEEITQHMVNISISVPQLCLKQVMEHIFGIECVYNTRKIIKPYELDVYFPEYKIAFEYDGKGWHNEDNYINKTKLCAERGIYLITLKERNRRYMEDVKEQLCEKISSINTWCKLNIKKEDIKNYNERIQFPKLFTEEELDILRNNDTSFLNKNYKNLYNKYKKYNPDNKVFTNIKWTREKVIEDLKKYNSLSELLECNFPLYSVIHKKFRDLLPLYNTQGTKPVICLTDGKKYRSILEASREYNINPKIINKICRKEKGEYKNLKFEYIDYIKDNKE